MQTMFLRLGILERGFSHTSSCRMAHCHRKQSSIFLFSLAWPCSCQGRVSLKCMACCGHKKTGGLRRLFIVAERILPVACD
jgi:hypothetical protein